MVEAFDTLTAAEKLQNGGLSDDQSKAIAHVIGDAITGNVATKSDVENGLKKFWLKFRIHMYLTQGALFLALVAILKD